MRMVETAMIGMLVVSAPMGFVAGSNFIPANFDTTLSQHVNEVVSAADGRVAEKSLKKVPPKKPKPYPEEGPGLRGATMPHRSPGEYSAGFMCKPSPPDHYVPVGALYPIPCPPNTLAPRGSQSRSQCREAESKGWKLFS